MRSSSRSLSDAGAGVSLDRIDPMSYAPRMLVDRPLPGFAGRPFGPDAARGGRFSGAEPGASRDGAHDRPATPESRAAGSSRGAAHRRRPGRGLGAGGVRFRAVRSPCRARSRTSRRRGTAAHEGVRRSRRGPGVRSTASCGRMGASSTPATAPAIRNEAGRPRRGWPLGAALVALSFAAPLFRLAAPTHPLVAAGLRLAARRGDSGAVGL
jgi:hypothetical protein